MRIRTTKPEFWRSGDTAVLGFFTRLLFIGLWNYVDDNGVGEDAEELIRSDLFPRDPVETVSVMIHDSLIELSVKGQIVRYQHLPTGRRYLKIVNWHHQKINRPTDSKKPLPTSTDVRLTDSSVSPHATVTEDSPPYLGIKGSREQGNEGAGEAPASRPQRRQPTFGEQLRGTPDTLPDAPPEDRAVRPVARTTAADLVRAVLPPNVYPDAVLTDIRLRVGGMLAEGVEPELIREALRLWDARSEGGPGLLPHLLADAAKSLRPKPAAATAYERKTAHNAAIFAQLANTPDDMPAKELTR